MNKFTIFRHFQLMSPLDEVVFLCLCPKIGVFTGKNNDNVTKRIRGVFPIRFSRNPDFTK